MLFRALLCYSVYYFNGELTMVRCHLSTFMGRDKLRIADVSRLPVKRQEVVSRDVESGHRCDASDATVRPVPVVVVLPTCQGKRAVR